MQVSKRFCREILATEVDISLCRIRYDDGGALRIGSQLRVERLLIGSVFAIPPA